MRGFEVSALLEIIRPLNAVGAGVLAFIGAFVAGGVPGEPGTVFGAVGATTLAVGAGNTLNDYFDREIDSINRPERPIPRGAVRPRVALAWSCLLFLCAIALSLVLPLPAVAIALVNFGFLTVYTTLFKQIPAAGNLVVAYLVGSAFLFGGATAGDMLAVVDLALLAGLATFAREVLKDVEDVQGDSEEGLATLPLVVGERNASLIGAVALVCAVLVSPLPVVAGTFGLEYLAVVFVADGLALTAALVGVRDPGRGQRLTKVAMFVAVGAFMFGQAAGEFL